MIWNQKTAGGMTIPDFKPYYRASYSNKNSMKLT